MVRKTWKNYTLRTSWRITMLWKTFSSTLLTKTMVINIRFPSWFSMELQVTHTGTLTEVAGPGGLWGSTESPTWSPGCPNMSTLLITLSHLRKETSRVAPPLLRTFLTCRTINTLARQRPFSALTTVQDWEWGTTLEWRDWHKTLVLTTIGMATKLHTLSLTGTITLRQGATWEPASTLHGNIDHI